MDYVYERATHHVDIFGINPILRSLATDRGLDAALATGVVMASSLGMACGRLFFPLMVDRLGRRNTALLLAILVFAFPYC